MLKINFSKIQTVCVLYLITWLIAPPLAYDMIFRMIAVVTALLWLCIEKGLNYRVMASPEARKILNIYLCFAGIYAAGRVIIGLGIEHKALSAIVNDNINIYILLLIGYISATYITKRDYKNVRIFFNYTVLIMTVFSLTTIFRRSEFQGFTRNAGGNLVVDGMVTDRTMERRAAMHGVAGFGFFCISSIFAPILFWLTLNIKDKRNIYAFATIILETGVFSAGYTLALLISVVGFLIVIMTSGLSQMTKLILFIMSIFLVLYYQTILLWMYRALANVLQGTFYENKLHDIFAFVLGGEEEGTFKDRSERYNASLIAIFTNPLLGSYIWQGKNVSGRHSSILDTFAAYGWILGYFWMYILAIFPSKLSGLIEKNKQYFWLCTIVLFATSLFNTMSMHFGVLSLIIPGAMAVLNKNKSDEGESIIYENSLDNI